MKIYCIIGSMNGKNSREFKVVNKLLSSKQYSNDEINIITADEHYIKYCQGCNICFKTGICPLDKTDDMDEIKKNLLQADLIIISSPVYIHQVSGYIKSLLDRLSYWTHTFHLIGKRIIVCTSTSGSGSEYVVSYLRKTMSALGGIVLNDIVVDDMTSFNEIDEKCQNTNEIITKSYQDSKYLSTIVTVFQHTSFKSLRISLLESYGYEHDYWINNKMFNFLTFKEYLIYKTKTHI